MKIVWEGKIKNFLLATVATVFAFLCAEGVLRILEPRGDGPINHVVNTELGNYSVPIPGAKRTLLGRVTSINKLGYRGAPYPLERNDNSFRIQVFGDSHAFGQGAPDGQSYPAVMEKSLNKGKNQYEVLNFGVGGHDFGSIEKHMSLNVPKYNPDLVIFTFHAGDIISTDIIVDNRATKNEPFIVKLKQGIVSRSYFGRLVALYGASTVRSLIGVQPPGGTVAEIREIEQNGVHWRNFKAVMLQFDEELRTRCTRFAVVLFPSMLDFENTPALELHSLIKSWLVENDIPVMDLLPVFQDSNRKASELWATLLDHHPNEEGYAIAGEAVASFVDSITRLPNPRSDSVCHRKVR